MRNVLSLAPNEVKKYFSFSVQICTAFGMTLAVFSLEMAVISRHCNVSCNKQAAICEVGSHHSCSLISVSCTVRHPSQIICQRLHVCTGHIWAYTPLTIDQIWAYTLPTFDQIWAYTPPTFDQIWAYTPPTFGQNWMPFTFLTNLCRQSSTLVKILNSSK